MKRSPALRGRNRTRNRRADCAPRRTRPSGGPRYQISFARDSYTFHFPGAPSAFVAAFRSYYGPTMSAFDAAEKSGRAADLQQELEALFEAQNTSPRDDTTSIPATFLRVTIVS